MAVSLNRAGHLLLLSRLLESCVTQHEAALCIEDDVVMVDIAHDRT